MAIQLVISDVQPATALGLRTLFAGTAGIQIAAVTSLPGDCVRAANARPGSVALVDKAFGAQAIGVVIGELRDIADCIVWGVSASEGETVRFLRLGAKGVLSKTANLDVVVHCVRAVADGLTWTEVRPRPVKARLPRHALTGREREIMDLVGRGMKNREVAGELGIQPGTVKVHLKHIFEKTGVADRYELALAGLIGE
ncbi:MAG TPA: response regulator transcription factor [Bryobacteraceae bacterium]|nr:response regulator transcription factor [Bryobacteraceae bacterium]